ncbi:MAG: DUF2064 domain-containing protein [Ignavibacteriae bacterium]|nr:DUF2064 domain-containing protein [Ignavibacteriota bacterium]
MYYHNVIIIFSKTPQINRKPDEPFASLAWGDVDALFSAMLGDIIETSCRVLQADVHLYRNPTEFSDDYLSPFRERIRCYDVQETPLAEQVQHAVDTAFAEHYSRIVVLLDNNPLITSKFLEKVLNQLEYEDDCLIVCPTVEGRFFLIGMKANYSSLFDTSAGDPLAKPDLLMERICDLNVVIFPTQTNYMLDSGLNLARLKDEIETLRMTKSEFPRRTYEIFKVFTKKYKVRKVPQ